MMRSAGFLAAVLLVTVAPAALADSIQLSVNSSVTAYLYSPNDNYWGFYRSFGSQQGDVVRVGTGPYGPTANFSSVSLFVPAGSVITSATLSVILPTNPIQGSGSLFVIGDYGNDNPGPIIAPTFSSTGASEVSVTGIYPAIPSSPVIDGNEVSTGNLDLQFDLLGSILGYVETPGSNWAGYIGGDGQVDIPYTVQMDVTYSPVPEPESLLLVATGGLTLLGALRRRVLQ